VYQIFTVTAMMLWILSYIDSMFGGETYGEFRCWPLSYYSECHYSFNRKVYMIVEGWAIGHCSYPQENSLFVLYLQKLYKMTGYRNLTWNTSTLNGKISFIDSLAWDIIFPCNTRISLDKFSSLVSLCISLIAAFLTGSGGQNMTFTCNKT
jgi:hypothetical protein